MPAKVCASSVLLPCSNSASCGFFEQTGFKEFTLCFLIFSTFERVLAKPTGVGAVHLEPQKVVFPSMLISFFSPVLITLADNRLTKVYEAKTVLDS